MGTRSAVRLLVCSVDFGEVRYDTRVMYSTFDVTLAVQHASPNQSIGAALWKGWYDLLPLRMWNNPDGTFVWRNQLASGVPRVIFQLNVEFNDGSWQRVSSAEANVRPLADAFSFGRDAKHICASTFLLLPGGTMCRW